MELTPAIVKEFARQMSEHFDTTIMDKEDAIEMTVLSYALDFMKITDRDKFMNHQALSMGTRLYFPFTPGELSPDRSLLAQVALITHEHVHVCQHRSNPGVYDIMYLADSAYRANKEAKGYSANIEIYLWMTGQHHAIESYGKILADSYHVDSQDVVVFQKTLELLTHSIKLGASVTKPARVAKRILRRLGVTPHGG